MINVLDDHAQLNDERAARPIAGSTASRRASASSPTSRRWACSRRSSRTTHTVPHGDRSGVVIEPWLTDQWYVNAAELAKPAIAAVEDGTTRVRAGELGEDLLRVDAQHPALVHLAPALVGPSDPGLVRAGRRGLRRRKRERSGGRTREKHYGKRVELRRDEDVLDTWFSSALWPFSTLGWPEKTPELARYYPTNVLVTGFDIIFFWVARMMMMGLHFMDEVPFRTSTSTPWCATRAGRRCRSPRATSSTP